MRGNLTVLLLLDEVSELHVHSLDAVDTFTTLIRSEDVTHEHHWVKDTCHDQLIGQLKQLDEAHFAPNGLRAGIDVMRVLNLCDFSLELITPETQLIQQVLLIIILKVLCGIICRWCLDH